jgi:hypothetical protein
VSVERVSAIDSVVFRFGSFPIVLTGLPIVLTGFPIFLTRLRSVLSGFPIVFTGFPIVFTGFPIVLTGFVILLAGSPIVIGRRLIHSSRQRKRFTGFVFSTTRRGTVSSEHRLHSRR